MAKNGDYSQLSETTTTTILTDGLSRDQRQKRHKCRVAKIDSLFGRSKSRTSTIVVAMSPSSSSSSPDSNSNNNNTVSRAPDECPNTESITSDREHESSRPHSSPMAMAMPMHVALQSSPATSISEYTSFVKSASGDGYIYPIRLDLTTQHSAVIASGELNEHEPKQEEGQEHTVENFNQFLASSMTENNDHNNDHNNDGHTVAMDCLNISNDDGHKIYCVNMSNDDDHTMEPIIDIDRDDDDDDEEEENNDNKTTGYDGDKEDNNVAGVWPERLLRSPELMADAPSGILLVFDRMLDCIDPSSSRGPLTKELLSEQMDDDDHSYSTMWSLSIGRSSLLQEFGDDYSFDSFLRSSSSNNNNSNNNNNKDRRRPPPRDKKRHPTPMPAEELYDNFDCIFPCWEENNNDDLNSLITVKKSLRDLAASDVGRKRKFVVAVAVAAAGEDRVGRRSRTTAVTTTASTSTSTTRLKVFAQHDSELFEEINANDHDHDDGDNDKINFRDFGDEPLDFAPILKLTEEPIIPLETYKNTNTYSDSDDESSSSSLSDLFDGLIFEPPSDEKDDDELDRFLDTTQETCTLSYSTGTF